MISPAGPLGSADELRNAEEARPVSSHCERADRSALGGKSRRRSLCPSRAAGRMGSCCLARPTVPTVAKRSRGNAEPHHPVVASAIARRMLSSSLLRSFGPRCPAAACAGVLFSRHDRSEF